MEKGTCKHGIKLTELCQHCAGENYGNCKHGFTLALPCVICKEEGITPGGVTVEQGINLAEPKNYLMIVKVEAEPAIVKIHKEALSLLQYAKARVIVTLKDAGKATEDGTIINKLNKELESRRKEYIAPFRNHIDEVNEAFKILAAPLKEAKQITDNKIMAFNQALRKKQLEQEAINRLRMEAAQKEAALNDGEIPESVNLVEVEKAPDQIRTNLGMAGETKRWTYEITDFALLPDMYKLENATLIRATIVGSKGKTEIPGVRAFQESKITYR